MKGLVTILGTIGLSLGSLGSTNIKNLTESKEISCEFNENQTDIINKYGTSTLNNPLYQSWDITVDTGLKSYQKPKSIRILECFLNNGSDKIDWGKDHYDVFSLPLKIAGEEITNIREGKITDKMLHIVKEIYHIEINILMFLLKQKLIEV